MELSLTESWVCVPPGVDPQSAADGMFKVLPLEANADSGAHGVTKECPLRLGEWSLDTPYNTPATPQAATRAALAMAIAPPH